jgi:sugar lactone lactonase YvrE
VFVGYGDGAIAILDPSTRTKTGDIKLNGHPESFRIDETGSRVFVNVPDAHAIEVTDLAAGISQSMPTPSAAANFPMAIDRDAHRVLVIFRHPPLLMALSSQDTHVVSKTATCGDADDVFVDGRRGRVYVSCGEGVVDVFAADAAGQRRLTRLPTAPGARTSLFVPDLDRLFVAVRATSSEPAAIWVFRPAP